MHRLSLQLPVSQTCRSGWLIMKQVEIDDIYKNVPLDKIPWNSNAPPEAIVELVNSGKVKPSRAVDLGCGAGNYAVYLAARGFNVTGIDASPTAVGIARENAKKRNAVCTFLVADVLGDLSELAGKFDFAYDWELLHHIFPVNRKKYAANVSDLLVRGGKYLSVCFSEKDPSFGGAGKYRGTQLGTLLYFSSEEELRNLFRAHFTILELKTIVIRGRMAPHQVVYAWMEKK